MLGRVTKSNRELQEAIVSIAKAFADGQSKSDIKHWVREKWPISARQFEVWCSRAYDWLKTGEGHVPATVVRAVLDEQCRRMLKDPEVEARDKVKALDLWARASGIIVTGGQINVNLANQVNVASNGKHAAAQVNWKALAQLQDATLKASSGSATIELQAVTPDCHMLPPVPDKPIDCVDVPTISSVVPQSTEAPTPQEAQPIDSKAQAQ